jgi:hypothetical protein
MFWPAHANCKGLLASATMACWTCQVRARSIMNIRLGEALVAPRYEWWLVLPPLA